MFGKWVINNYLLEIFCVVKNLFWTPFSKCYFSQLIQLPLPAINSWLALSQWENFTWIPLILSLGLHLLKDWSFHYFPIIVFFNLVVIMIFLFLSFSVLLIIWSTVFTLLNSFPKYPCSTSFEGEVLFLKCLVHFLASSRYMGKKQRKRLFAN